jgi:hypothetical protein
MLLSKKIKVVPTGGGGFDQKGKITQTALAYLVIGTHKEPGVCTVRHQLI